MMNVKKGIIFFGAVVLSLLLVSSATAVPQVHSQPLVNKIENEREDPYDFLEELTNYVDFDADKDRVLAMKSKIESFIADKSLSINNYQESSFYQTAEFQDFLNKDGGLESNLQSLAEEASAQWDFYYNTYGAEAAKEYVIGEVIKPFFEDLFNGVKYADLLDAFEGDSRSLAEDLGKVYNARSKNTVVSTTGINEEPTVGTLGFFAEQLLISICTIIFLANWIVFGNLLGEVTEPFVAMILGALLIIPAIIILAADVVVGNVYVAFESAIVAVITLTEIFAETLAKAVHDGGLLGLLVWGIAFCLNIGLVPLELFVIFVITYFEHTDVKLGYIIEHLGPFLSEILERAAENARDIWGSIFGSINGNPSLTPRFARFLALVGDRFPVLKFLLIKYVTN